MTPKNIEKSQQFRIHQSRSYYSSLSAYRGMMSDRRRNNFYNSILSQVKGKTVLDIGAGVGALSLAAIKAGAKKVYAVEVNPEAVELLKKVRDENQFYNLEIINASSWDLKLPEKVDFIVHEIFGPFLLDELCLITLDDVKKHLAPGGKMLPEEFGFIFKPYSLARNSDSVQAICELNKTYKKLNEGQIIIEDLVTEDPYVNSIEFGPFKFDNYPLNKMENSVKLDAEVLMDSLWVVPYVQVGSTRLLLCKQDHSHHWGNTFLAIDSFVDMDKNTTVSLKFYIDESLASFNTSLELY